ncbi:putative RING finger E3 ubiquitin ligase [Brazilian marseillevirus]|uniref:putative RING finger E3 ubiquitin ligase n=1 Tax=Brazilian marseillevirus TaxID=1813599 RepID=UPI0007816C94|nr:putative RING finger E3 ubiquitin ligase [Brazilian marseillevirus]AMQ10755.1 putative RING finger E3 ubiquitin ligase [Brazilian marseillevirus]
MQQCQGFSSSGEQCKRKTKEPSGLCFSHKPETETFSEECAICLSKFSKGSGVVLSCKHRFHKKCIKEITSPSCPCCRQEIKEGDVPNKFFRRIDDVGTEFFAFIMAIQEEFGLRVYVVSPESNFHEIMEE